MALPATPTKYVSKPGVGTFHSDVGGLYEPIRRGRSGWPVYALQRAVGVKPATGTFGAATLKAVKRWQKAHGLVADGVAGPKTQEAILIDAGEQADRANGLPEGIGRGFAKAEGANLLAATNWSVPGGVDCGPAQWRIAGPPFSLTTLKRAFRPYAALEHAGLVLRNRQIAFMAENRHLKADPQTALDVAVFAHHWPHQGGADRVVDLYPGDGKWWRYVSNPDSPATWIGEPGEHPTRANWAREYVARVMKFTA